MFNFMKKEKTEEERAEKERRKSEKRERKKSSKREKLSQDELQRLEEVRRSLKIKGGNIKRSKEGDFSDEVDRASVVGLRYSQFYLGGSESGVASPDSSDSASTWSSASLSRPRGILKSRGEDRGSVSQLSQSSSKVDLDDENLLLKNTAQNEMISYNKSPGFTAEADTEHIYAYHHNPSLDPGQWDSGDSGQPGECTGLKSRRLLSNFPLNLPVIIQVPPTEAWKRHTLSRSASGSDVQVR